MSTQIQGELVPEWTVGDRLRKARELFGLEQGPFAALIGVSRGTVSNYERGATERYKPIVMNAWAAHTGVPLEWLESGDSAVGSQPPPPDRSPPNPKLERLTERKRGRARGHDTTRGYVGHVPAAAHAA